jgi:hypothetical protein
VIEPLPPWEAQPPEATRIVINLRGGAFEGYQLEGKLRGRVEVELRDWDIGRYEPDELELVAGKPAFVCREAYEPLERLGRFRDCRVSEHRA